jgi:hypothetical protein
MVDLAAQQQGFLGAESTRGEDGFGITVSYWSTAESIARWKQDAAVSTGPSKALAAVRLRPMHLPATCPPSSWSIILNAKAGKPAQTGRPWRGPWHLLRRFLAALK